MKTKLLILSIIFFAYSLSYSQSDNKKYLILTVDQLKEIGFVINEQGIFFISELPPDNMYKNQRITIGYFNNNYSSRVEITLTKMQNIRDTQTIQYGDSLTFCHTPALKLDYYLIKIVEVKGAEIYRSELKKPVTIPFLIKQSDYNFSNKKDIIVYLKLTKSLKDKLSYISDFNDYIVRLSNE